MCHRTKDAEVLQVQLEESGTAATLTKTFDVLQVKPGSGMDAAMTEFSKRLGSSRVFLKKERKLSFKNYFLFSCYARTDRDYNKNGTVQYVPIFTHLILCNY